MRWKWKIILGVGLVCGIVVAGGQKPSNADTERYIKDSESQWAEAVASGDSSVVKRILADDFLGVDTDGSHFDKAGAIRPTQEGARDYVSNHVNDVKVRFYGDAAVAQGSETWVRKNGSQLHGRFVWTDTWIKRNGQWQIVASEDLIPPEGTGAKP